MRISLVALLISFAATGPSLAATLDLNNPEHAVKALQKLQCHLEDGKPAVYWWTGSAFSRVPGEKDQKLFDYHGMNVRACKSFEDPEKGYGYRMVSREILMYQDPETGEFIHTWTNPWTDEELEVVHIANDPVNSRGVIWANGARGPFTLDATMVDGRGWLAFQVPLFYTNPLGGEYQEYIGGTYQAIEMFTFFFDANRLLDADVTGLDNAHVGWSRMSKWLPWMRMGDRAGQMMFTGAGKRLATWDDMPEVFKAQIREHYPEYDAPPPLDDDRPNETSWTYFKKVIDQERSESDEGEASTGH